MLGGAKFEVKASAEGISGAASESEVAYGVGVGYLFKGEGNVGGFVEAVYVGIATSGSAATYISLRGGLSLFFGGNSTQ